MTPPFGAKDNIDTREEEQVNQREIKQNIKNNPALTATEKVQKLNELRAPYKAMTDEELL